SIQVPAHNEPPELLRQTLRSLAELDWENYEVLVIDNNTADESLWRPVEAYCRELGPRFRFFHVENLAGFKAGALNYVSEFMDPRARFVFVVDADYIVEPNALRLGVRYFTDPKIGLIQFPQDYRNVGPGNIGIALDFKHFFAGYMTMANTLGCVPATGTLSLINADALKAVGGFGTAVITEDADLGFRFSLKGYRSVYANVIVGRGMMPHDLESLKKQRWRWAFGNAQILKLNWRTILFGRGLCLGQRLGFIAHLTAWFNFNLIPSVSLIILAPLALFNHISVTQNHIVILSGLTLVTFMVMRFGTMFYSLRREGHSLSEIWLAYLTHVSLGWVFSASWLKCLWNHRAPFVRTNKFLGRMMPGVLSATVIELALGACLLAACCVLTLTDFIIGPIAAILMCGARFLIYWVWHQTKYTLRISSELFTESPGESESREEEAVEAAGVDDAWSTEAAGLAEPLA
ncbi:MAG TPA: glycosyltransferase, partial [Verrucomicrobiae bacterium]|nr:glycosyltransferase [Verrucomicrobiae bacterium]